VWELAPDGEEPSTGYVAQVRLIQNGITVYTPFAR
jgi:hypothetical protein